MKLHFQELVKKGRRLLFILFEAYYKCLDRKMDWSSIFTVSVHGNRYIYIYISQTEII